MLMLAVGASNSLAEAEDPNMQEVLWPAKSWRTSSPEERGMDPVHARRRIRVSASRPMIDL